MMYGCRLRGEKREAGCLEDSGSRWTSIHNCSMKSGSVNVASVIRAQDRMTITAYYCVTVWQQLLVVQEGIMCTYR